MQQASSHMYMYMYICICHASARAPRSPCFLPSRIHSAEQTFCFHAVCLYRSLSYHLLHALAEQDHLASRSAELNCALAVGPPARRNNRIRAGDTPEHRTATGLRSDDSDREFPWHAPVSRLQRQTRREEQSKS